jgi:hypothetical protein
MSALGRDLGLQTGEARHRFYPVSHAFLITLVALTRFGPSTTTQTIEDTAPAMERLPLSANIGPEVSTEGIVNTGLDTQADCYFLRLWLCSQGI